MARRAEATPTIESAARLVASWRDLWRIQPHEFSAHFAFHQMAVEYARALGSAELLHLQGRFRVPQTSDVLLARLSVARFGRDWRSTMIEGALRDIEKYYPDGEMLARLRRNERGPIGSWELWINAHFLNGIREGLFGLHGGGAWKSLKGQREAPAASLAYSTLQFAAARRRIRGRLGERVDMVLRRSTEIGIRTAPRNLPLDVFAKRNPPDGVKRKGSALTVLEAACEYLVANAGMSYTQAARELGIPDWRQVRRAVIDSRAKRRRWVGG